MHWNDLYFDSKVQILGLPRAATVHLYNNVGTIARQRGRRICGELFSADRGFYVIDPIHTDQTRWAIDTFNIDKEQWFDRKCELVLDKGIDDFFVKFFPTHLEQILNKQVHLYQRIISKPFIVIYSRNWQRQILSYVYSMKHNQWSWDQKKYDRSTFTFPLAELDKLILKQYDLLFKHLDRIPKRNRKIITAESIALWEQHPNNNAPDKIYDQDKWQLYTDTIENADDILKYCEEHLQTLRKQYNFQLAEKGNKEIIIS